MGTILDVDSIATDDDLVAEVSSRARLDRANKDVAQRDAIRRAALADVLEALKTRTPAVTDLMLADPTELRRAVVYRSLAKIFLSAIAVEGDVHQVLHRSYQAEYQAAVRAPFSLRPLGGPQSSSGFSIRVERR